MIVIAALAQDWPGSATRHARPSSRGRSDAERGDLGRRSRGHITLRDARLQFESGPPWRGASRRGGGVQTNDRNNAIIAKVSPYVPANEVATALALEAPRGADPGAAKPC
jgi:hypothetical protein